MAHPTGPRQALSLLTRQVFIGCSPRRTLPLRPTQSSRNFTAATQNRFNRSTDLHAPSRAAQSSSKDDTYIPFEEASAPTSSSAGTNITALFPPAPRDTPFAEKEPAQSSANHSNALPSGFFDFTPEIKLHKPAIDVDITDPAAAALLRREQQHSPRKQPPLNANVKPTSTPSPTAQDSQHPPTANTANLNSSPSSSSSSSTTTKPPPTTPNPNEPTWSIQKRALRSKLALSPTKPWSPPKRLSPDALEGIRALHAQHPEHFTTPMLADHFRVSPEAIRRILKSNWRPSSAEEDERRERWERRGEKAWREMVARKGVRPPRKWRERGIGRGVPRRKTAEEWRALVGDDPWGVRERREKEKEGGMEKSGMEGSERKERKERLPRTEDDLDSEEQRLRSPLGTYRLAEGKAALEKPVRWRHTASDSTAQREA